MRRGTTPTFYLSVMGVDLTECTVTVAISQSALELVITDAEVGYSTGSQTSTVYFTLSQEDTLQFTAGQKARIQVRYIDADGIANATAIKSFEVTDVIDNEVLTYGR